MGKRKERRLAAMTSAGRKEIWVALQLKMMLEGMTIPKIVLGYPIHHLLQGHDDHLMDSPSCIHFLMKMLKLETSITSTCKVPSIGSILLALKKDASYLQDSNGVDSLVWIISSTVWGDKLHLTSITNNLLWKVFFLLL